MKKDDRRDRLLRALLTADSLKAAAAEAEIPYDSARRFLREPPFQAALAALRREAADAALLDAIRLAQLARDALAEILANPHAADYVRVRAAEAVLNYERATLDLFDVHERLAALEGKLDEQAERDDRPPAASPPRRPNHDGAGAEIETKDQGDAL